MLYNFKIHHTLSPSLVKGSFSPTSHIVSSIIVVVCLFCFVLLIFLCIYVFLSFTSVRVSVYICFVMFFFSSDLWLIYVVFFFSVLELCYE